MHLHSEHVFAAALKMHAVHVHAFCFEQPEELPWELDAYSKREKELHLCSGPASLLEMSMMSPFRRSMQDSMSWHISRRKPSPT